MLRLGRVRGLGKILRPHDGVAGVIRCKFRHPALRSDVKTGEKDVSASIFGQSFALRAARPPHGGNAITTVPVRWQPQMTAVYRFAARA
jgi:hypothetical protein